MILRLIIVSIISVLSLNCSAQHSRALLVGIANYPEESGWRKIHSDNDVRLLEKMLSKSFVVETLVDKAATYRGINQALTKLEGDVCPADTVVLLFSCHGQQMLGSDEPDSLDEALIPYDALSTYSESYKGERHFKDDELSKHIERIRRKAGNKGLVIVLLDACHSGDSFRNADETQSTTYLRGGYPVFGKESSKETQVDKELRKRVKLDLTDQLADVIYIGACQSYQVNQEVKIGEVWYGSLAFAFMTAYEKYKLHNLQDLCNSISNDIYDHHPTTRQCPEFASSIEGILRTIEEDTIPCDTIPCDAFINGIKSRISEFLPFTYKHMVPVSIVLFSIILLIIAFLWKKK